jgi:Major Facilitator Superfamily
MLMLRTVRGIVENHASGDPVPVFVPMTSWNPKYDSLRAWLEKQVPIDYPGLGASVTMGDKRTTLIAMLLDEQKIMPILDGLDEMPVGAQVEAINKLNEAFTAPARPLRLVVTCRTRDYQQAVGNADEGWNPNPVGAAAAIELHTLDPDKVSSYLAGRGDDRRWATVDTQLRRPGSGLATALNTPLYASLASEIYNPSRRPARGKLRKPEELCTLGDVRSVHHYLLDEFIPAMYADEREAQEERAADEGEEPGQLPAGATDPPLPAAERPDFSWRALARSWWPAGSWTHDFRWAWLTRFLLVLGNAMAVVYLLYFLRRIGFSGHGPRRPAEQALVVLLAAYTVAVVATTATAGRRSDRTGRRRRSVALAGGIMAAATLLVATWPRWPVLLASAPVIGIGFGIYLSVDQALVTQVLPSAADRARSLGVISVASSAGQAAAPAIAAPVVTYLGGFSTLYLCVAGIVLLGSASVWRIRSVP